MQIAHLRPKTKLGKTGFVALFEMGSSSIMASPRLYSQMKLEKMGLMTNFGRNL